jgi:hypothetical protein
MDIKEMRLAKMIRKAFPNDDRFKFGDDILSSFQEVKEVVSKIVNPPTNDAFDFIVTESLVQETTNYYWQKSGRIVLHGEAELFGMILHQISHIGIMHSELCKKLQEYDNQVIQLKRLLESEPRRIHLKSDNSSGLSCVITSDLLKYRLLNSLNYGLNHEESPLLNLKPLTYDLGEFVHDFEGTANLLLRQKAGKVASYVLLGDLIYMFKGIAPNPDKWSDCNPKEKYDIVKAWVKQYKKHKSEISY